MINDDEGNVAVIAALCLLPLCFVIGMSIDLSNATRTRLALQDATDSAALAIARNAATLTDAQVPAAAKNYVDASYEKSAAFTIATATIDRTTLTVTIDAKANVPTTFAGILGKTVLPVSAHSVVQGKGADYEIALVLDNSGSMSASLGNGSTKIAELKKASTALFDAMLTAANVGKVQIGVVPFASSVKVGTGYKNAAWIDKDGLANYSHENWAGNAKRFDLFAAMSNASWAGCVESRPRVVGGANVDYDVNDATPSPSKPETLFEPWFAPDEPDGWSDNGSSYSYSNDYLDDEGGDCTGSSKSKSASDTTKQQRTCKYTDEWVNTSNGMGPNYMCDTTALTPLTGTRSTLDSAISAMQADGNTNIIEGLMWGWRVISPTEPFTQGKAYNTPNLSKVIILMTDGQNNINGVNNINKSVYSSYGYMAANRMGTTSNNTATINAKMDERLAVACVNAKAAGITIYTVGLGDTGDVDVDLLTACASKTNYAYFPKSGAELTPAFQAIAASINKLRLSQ